MKGWKSESARHALAAKGIGSGRKTKSISITRPVARGFFDNLKGAILVEETERLNRDLDKIKTEEGLKNAMSWHGKTYKINEKEKFTKFLEKQAQKSIEEKLQEISEIENAGDFDSPLIITIDWKRSQMWGHNPTAHTNHGFTGSSIGGAGYDKQSTALAEALNSYKPLMKLLYKKKNDWLKKGISIEKGKTTNHEVFGYGSGYGILPKFEGGVGDSSHINIIKNLGLSVEHSGTDNTDVYVITKKGGQ